MGLSLETFIYYSTAAQALAFGTEMVDYLFTGMLKIHRGEAGMENYSVSSKDVKFVLVHGTLMFLWLIMVVYQLMSRGRGHHKTVGYISTVAMLYAVITIIPIGSKIPGSHALLHFSVVDWGTTINALAIAVSAVVGVWLAAVKGNMSAHRTLMLICVLFTAAPGTFRVLFKVGLHLLPHLGVPLHGYELFWNELIFELVIFSHLWWALYLIGFRQFLGVCKSNVVLGFVLMSLVASLTLLFGFYIVDTTAMWHAGMEYPKYTKHNSPMWAAYLL